MTLPVQYKKSQVWGKKPVHTVHVRNIKTAQALKRYLDLTLNGSKRILAESGRSGRKGHPPSPYTFDKPDVESSVRDALLSETQEAGFHRAPEWINEINYKIQNHNGEAPMFTEKFLPTSKDEQRQPPGSRPMSGLSTKSAPIVIDGEMYYRPSKKHSFLQASSRPSSAKENRITRATALREEHRTQAMSAVPSNDTKMQLKRMKDTKPRPLHLNKDLLPIPCHTGETPHSFVVGARYNHSHYLDSRSFARIGLYLPRRDPLRPFLKVYRGENAYDDVTSNSDFAGFTSVRHAESSGKTQSTPAGVAPHIHSRLQPPLPKPYLRKVIKEAWLSGGLPPRATTAPHSTKMPPAGASPQLGAAIKPNKPKLQCKAPAPSPRRQKSAKAKESENSVRLQGQQVPVSPDIENRAIKRTSPVVPPSKSSPIMKKQSIEAVLPTTH